jgi:DNA-binding transcriptional regulator YiaG
MDQSLEEWRPVVGYEGLYEVSSLGRVRGVTRRVPNPSCKVMTVKGKILRLYQGKHGYMQFGPWKDGAQRTLLVHQEVLRAFVGEPRGLECRHLDGDRTNNALTNLRYGTKSQNADDKNTHGTMARGTRQGLSKLTEADVLHIRRDRSMTIKALAELYGIHCSTVFKVRRGETWRHVNA